MAPANLLIQPLVFEKQPAWLVNPCQPGHKQDDFCAPSSNWGMTDIRDEVQTPEAQRDVGPSRLHLWLI